MDARHVNLTPQPMSTQPWQGPSVTSPSAAFATRHVCCHTPPALGGAYTVLNAPELEVGEMLRLAKQLPINKRQDFLSDLAARVSVVDVRKILDDMRHAHGSTQEERTYEALDALVRQAKHVSQKHVTDSLTAVQLVGVIPKVFGSVVEGDEDTGVIHAVNACSQSLSDGQKQ